MYIVHATPAPAQCCPRWSNSCARDESNAVGGMERRENQDGMCGGGESRAWVQVQVQVHGGGETRVHGCKGREKEGGEGGRRASVIEGRSAGDARGGRAP